MPQAKYDLSVLNFILALKNLDFAPKYERNPDGVITSSTNNGIIMWGEGRTIEESRADLMSALRDTAKFYFEDFSEWYAGNPEQYPYALKVMLSSDEELKRCLSCETCEDI